MLRYCLASPSPSKGGDVKIHYLVDMLENKNEIHLEDFVPEKVTKHPSLREGLGGLNGLGGLKPKWATANALAYTMVENNAVKNRKAMTAAEQALWEQFRSNKLGVRFRRQHVIGTYIVDFVCLKCKLVVEVDGEYHSSPEQQLLDAERTAYLKTKGYRVVRFTNSQVLTDIESVMSQIIRSLI